MTTDKNQQATPATDSTGMPFSFRDAYAGATVVVVGGSGFIGTNLVDELHSLGADVINIDIAPPRSRRPTVRREPIDILDAPALALTIRDLQPRIVFHLAARTDMDGGPTGYEANEAGVRSVLEAVAAAGSVERTMFTSSQLVCRLGYQPRGDTDYAPSSEYGRSKVRGEQVVRAWEDPVGTWAIVRPTSIWGPWFDQPYRPFFEAVLTGRFVLPSGLQTIRSFGYVGNVVHQYLGLAVAPDEEVHGRTFYLSDYEPIPLRDWAELIRRTAGLGPLREFPDEMMTAIAYIGSALQRVGWRRAPLTASRLANMRTTSVVDMTPTGDIVGPLPFKVEQGIAATLEWLRVQAP